MRPKPPGRATHNSGAEQATTRKRGKRGGGRRLRREIERAAEERQEAWSEGDHPNVTAAKTEELDRLFGEMRSQRASLVGELRARRGLDDGAPFRRPTPEMRAESGKPRKPPKHDWAVEPDEPAPVRIWTVDK